MALQVGTLAHEPIPGHTCYPDLGSDPRGGDHFDQAEGSAGGGRDARKGAGVQSPTGGGPGYFDYGHSGRYRDELESRVGPGHVQAAPWEIGSVGYGYQFSVAPAAHVDEAGC